MGVDDGLQGDGLVLSRIALLEHRLQSLARLVMDLRGARMPMEGPCEQTVIEADDQAELATGFHHREHDGAGNPFRWAGKSDHFELRFHHDRFASCPFRMVGTFADGVTPDRLRAYVDYRQIPLHVEFDGPTAIVAGRIPADPLGGATTLTFHCPAIAAPNPVDRRRLSFAFVRFVAGEAKMAREAA